MAEPTASRPTHPRRPPAHQSVSLRHSRSPPLQRPTASHHPRHRARIPSSNLANPPSSIDSRPEHRKESSGESSNADKWFERSNNQVEASTNHFGDNDPPFFLRNSSSSETPPDVVESRMAQLNQQPSMLPYRNSLMRQETQGSSSEDFRSVIDDLTVQNKKLKKKLRKYEKIYDSNLQPEKLFEIRMHGLTGSKKKELEETLRKFAMSLDDDKVSPPTDSMASGYGPSTPALEPHVTTSSHSSRFADSAYISNSASGQNSLAAQSGPTSAHGKKDKYSKAPSARQQDIHSYLRDIPAGLLPRQPVAMTEKAKRKLVVRRLEQIFAGKGAAVGGHQQPLQQQEVSQSAATADRLAIEATGQRAKLEGIREARIMSKGDASDASHMEPAQEQHSDHTIPSHYTTGKSSPDQRPTRPLDLDPHRAQVPQDNIDYIRHLGFSPADYDADEREDGHGWIYLNVLTNMAQLHTLNVTTDFVKKSVNDHSSKLRISRDGRKVRWKGGNDVTHGSSDGSPGEGTVTQPTSGKGKIFSSRKKPSLQTTFSEGSSVSPHNDSRTGSSNKLAYIPLFSHKQSSEDDEGTSDEHVTSRSSPQQEQLAGDSSGFTSFVMRTNSSKRKRGDDGPIIFYNKARFCTDLSGDQNARGGSKKSPLKYNTIVANPVGMDLATESEDNIEVGRDRPLTMTMFDDLMDVDDRQEAQSDSDIKLSPKTAASSGHVPSSPAKIDFEASGLGGVQPTDNFKIEVQSRCKPGVGQVPPSASHFPRAKPYPRRIMDALNMGTSQELSTGGSSLDSPAVAQEVVSTRQESLPASALPPPASFFISSPEDDSDNDTSDSGAESDVSSLENDDRPVPSAIPQMLNFPSHSLDEEDDEDEDMVSDGSLDFLATAREVDPLAVHEKEREYNANMAERLAEDIPAGSSAATAGGGSGFNSPASPELAGSKSARRSSAGNVPRLKRARISDTSVTQASASKRR